MIDRLDVLRAVWRFQAQTKAPMPTGLLRDVLGAHPKVLKRKIEKLERKGLVAYEHNGPLALWITVKGATLIHRTVVL